MEFTLHDVALAPTPPVEPIMQHITEKSLTDVKLYELMSIVALNNEYCSEYTVFTIIGVIFVDKLEIIFKVNIVLFHKSRR